jgi:glutaredoxin
LAKFTIYSITDCSFCVRARDLAEDKGLDYEIINLNQDPSAKKWFKHKGLKTAPQIYHGPTHIGGYAEFQRYVKRMKVH